MSEIFEITYTNETGSPCKAVIHDEAYACWTKNKSTPGTVYEIQRTRVGKFLDSIKNCSNISVKEVDKNAK